MRMPLQELTAAFDSKTLGDMNIHTGFALSGYDLVRSTPVPQPLTLEQLLTVIQGYVVG